MLYLGIPLRLDCDRADQRDEVTVEQQHCGGNSLIIYDNKLTAGDEFSFTSERHHGFPFGVTIYVNGVHDSRLSACCEYRHRLHAVSGSKAGTTTHFVIVGVHGGAPCYRCRAEMFKRAGAQPNKHFADGHNGNYDGGDTDYTAATVDDNMLYITVESDDEEINIQPGDDESDYSMDDTDKQNEPSGKDKNYQEIVQHDHGVNVVVPESSEPSLKSVTVSEAANLSHQSQASSTEDGSEYTDDDDNDSESSGDNSNSNSTRQD
jgi:hypothetical protein